ncbi:MAG: 2-dehydropantoate 2-reductase [Alistipes sp.]|nr:2-dehydropantoate 2-reductase [Alistipes sp.]
MKPVKIAIVGTGGVGGFIGGKLAAYYAADPLVEIYFISRGEALQQIRKEGLRIDTQQERIVAHPTLATDDASQIGIMDYILLCTKSYDIERAVQQMQPAIDAHTLLLPFLNGVDSAERIKACYPHQTVWSGCVYIVAYIVSPGHIAERTNGYRYLFGSESNAQDPRLEALEQLFTKASIRARKDEAITRRVWDKFAFISSVATATSYTDLTYGEILGTPSLRAEFLQLIEEFLSIAQARHITLSEDVTQQILTQMERIPADTTTSMQRDFRAHRTTEVESLTGYIVREGVRLGIATPTYDRMYTALKTRCTTPQEA